MSERVCKDCGTVVPEGHNLCPGCARLVPSDEPSPMDQLPEPAAAPAPAAPPSQVSAAIHPPTPLEVPTGYFAASADRRRRSLARQRVKWSIGAAVAVVALVALVVVVVMVDRRSPVPVKILAATCTSTKQPAADPGRFRVQDLVTGARWTMVSVPSHSNGVVVDHPTVTSSTGPTTRSWTSDAAKNQEVVLMLDTKVPVTSLDPAKLPGLSAVALGAQSARTTFHGLRAVCVTETAGNGLGHILMVQLRAGHVGVFRTDSDTGATVDPVDFVRLTTSLQTAGA